LKNGLTDRVPVKGKGTFKYHITLREWVCSNRQSISSYGEGGGLAKSSYNFYSG